MRKIKLDKELIQTTLNANTSKKATAKQLGICIDTLSKLMKEYDIPFTPTIWSKGKELPNKAYLNINKEWLIKNWINTDKSLHTLANEHNIPESLLESRVTKYKLTKDTKYQLNLNKLYDLTDPHIYYLAGLIATDGYLPSHLQDTLYIQLSGDSELQLLQNISSYYQSTCPIRSYSNNRHLLRWNQPGLHNFLVNNFNLTLKDKTFTVKVPTKFFNEECVKAYILGCLDGDGWISGIANRVKLTTVSEDFVHGLHDLIEATSGINIQYRLESRKNRTKFYPTIEVAGNTAKEFLTWVYSVNLEFKLERKYNNFAKVNDIV